MSPRSPRRWPVLLALPLALAFGPDAHAARDRTAEKVGELRLTVDSITTAVEGLERQVAPGRGFITEDDAVRRFEDYVYLHMIGEHELAAEGFFTLVTLAALGDAGLHRDAEWYLAESLFEMGNTSTAEARYRVIADDDEHPFRDDAVRRLLELYAVTGQTEQFDAFYEKEIVQGRVTPSDLITYSLAKSFYRQGKLDEAVEHLEELGPDSEYWAKARYFLGVIAVVREDLDAALGYFGEAADVTVEDTEDRQVQDLSLLALARIHYERGELEEAAEFYGRVGGDSPYLADKLYEVIWTFIKQKEYRAALDGVEIFLIRFPEHEYTAQLRLLEAHLRLEQKEFDAALTAYQSVVTDYTPVRERFGELSESESEPRAYFKQILAAAEGDPTEATGLPGYAVAMMISEPTMARALDVFREIDRQETQIEESEALIGELREVMDAASGIGGYERLRYEVAVEQGRATDAQLALLSLEESWLEGQDEMVDERDLSAGKAMRVELGRMVERLPDDQGSEYAVQARRDHMEAMSALEEQVEGLRTDATRLRAALEAQSEAVERGEEPTLTPREELEARATLQRVETDLDEVVAELESVRAAGPSTAWSERLAEQELVIAATVEEVRRAYLPAREGVDDPDGTLERVDRLQTTLAADQKRLASLRDKLVSAESTELARIRARFEHEVREVGSQRIALSETLEEAEDVSVALTRSGFGRLEDFFSESVLRADMGIVDVYWSQKIDVADQRERMASEKAELLSDLEERFSLIREKLGQ